MAYYNFEKCPEKCLGDIGELCDQFRLTEKLDCQAGSRQWFDGRGTITMVDCQSREGFAPLFVQTHASRDHTNMKDVLFFIKELLRITGTEQLYEDSSMTRKLDMSTFY